MAGSSLQREMPVGREDVFKHALAATRVVGRNALISIGRAMLSFIKWFVIGLTLSLIRFAVGMLILVWLGSVFLEAVRDLAKEWDTYPNSSNHIMEAFSKRGPGDYDLTELMEMEISAVCISVGGTDPRKLAAQELMTPDEFLDAEKNPYFVREGTTSLIFLNDTKFKIESINKNDLYFGERYDRCISGPRAIILTIRPERSRYSSAKFTATLTAE